MLSEGRKAARSEAAGAKYEKSAPRRAQNMTEGGLNEH
ncbi:MAG: hypothetical protein QG578_2139 [Thermodesulfobacteriota bacterium]|nr:hypothetical protein [Thermodesulfobacteriota bacterium]